jgi:hypothetical protein
MRGDTRPDAVIALSSFQVFPSELDSKFSFAFHCKYISTLLPNLQILDEDSRKSISFLLSPHSRRTLILNLDTLRYNCHVISKSIPKVLSTLGLYSYPNRCCGRCKCLHILLSPETLQLPNSSTIAPQSRWYTHTTQIPLHHNKS